MNVVLSRRADFVCFLLQQFLGFYCGIPTVVRHIADALGQSIRQTFKSRLGFVRSLLQAGRNASSRANQFLGGCLRVSHVNSLQGWMK